MNIGYMRLNPAIPQREWLEGIELNKTVIDRVAAGEPQPKLAELEYSIKFYSTLYIPNMAHLAGDAMTLQNRINHFLGRHVTVKFISEHLQFGGYSSRQTDSLKLAMIFPIASFYLSINREKLATRVALAKSRGVYRGRKRVLSEAQLKTIRQKIAAGESKSLLARQYNISRATLYNYLNPLDT